MTLPRAWNEDDAFRKDIKDLSGRHENGVTAFGFDVTDLLPPAPQENVVAARRRRLEL